MNIQEIHSKLINKLENWLDGFVAMLPNIAMALLVGAVFWAFAKIARDLSDRALQRMRTHQAARTLIARIVHFAVLGIGLVVALGILDLDKALASILAGAGVVGLALGFAFQDLGSNLISGVGLAINRNLPFKIGDVVETNDVFGEVTAIHLRTSIVRCLDGKTVILPNSKVFQDKVTNYSMDGEIRVDIACGVSYGDDLQRVVEVARKALETIEPRVPDRDVDVLFREFGDSSINFVGRFWIKYDVHADLLRARHSAVIQLKQAFDEADIMIPFPIRTLDFGIRGGQPLKEAWPEREALS